MLRLIPVDADAFVFYSSLLRMGSEIQYFLHDAFTDHSPPNSHTKMLAREDYIIKILRHKEINIGNGLYSWADVGDAWEDQGSISIPIEVIERKLTHKPLVSGIYSVHIIGPWITAFRFG